MAIVKRIVVTLLLALNWWLLKALRRAMARRHRPKPALGSWTQGRRIDRTTVYPMPGDPTQEIVEVMQGYIPGHVSHFHYPRPRYPRPRQKTDQ